MDDVAGLYEERPVQNGEGTWDVLDGYGFGHVLGLASESEAQIWLNGYNAGAAENS